MDPNYPYFSVCVYILITVQTGLLTILKKHGIAGALHFSLCPSLNWLILLGHSSSHIWGVIFINLIQKWFLIFRLALIWVVAPPHFLRSILDMFHSLIKTVLLRYNLPILNIHLNGFWQINLCNHHHSHDNITLKRFLWPLCSLSPTLPVVLDNCYSAFCHICFTFLKLLINRIIWY